MNTNHITKYEVSTQEQHRPTVYVEIYGPLSYNSDEIPEGSWGHWIVYTKKFFGLVQNRIGHANNLHSALEMARAVAEGRSG